MLNLWDCGGQDAFMETFFTSQKDVLFSNVEVIKKYIQSYPDLPCILDERKNARYIGRNGIVDINIHIRFVFGGKGRDTVYRGER